MEQKSNRLQQNYTNVQMRQMGPGVGRLLQMRDSNFDSGPKPRLPGTRTRSVCISTGWHRIFSQSGQIRGYGDRRPSTVSRGRAPLGSAGNIYRSCI